MIQEILTYLIVSAAFAIAVYRILQSFNLIGGKTANTAKCSSCSGGCEVKELHVMNGKKLVKHNKYQFYRPA
ncbi:MAG: FeoB-associated Cys-rich membrane protein [Prolixibacteraceae bacterium]